MKKILTLFIALGAAGGVFAQHSNPYPDRGPSHDVILGGGNDRTVYNNDNSRYDSYYSAKERDRETQRINREFEARIRDVERNRWMRPSEKSYQIRLLEQQRWQQVQAVKNRFQNNRNRYDDPYERKNRRW